MGGGGSNDGASLRTKEGGREGGRQTAPPPLHVIGSSLPLQPSFGGGREGGKVIVLFSLLPLPV